MADNNNNTIVKAIKLSKVFGDGDNAVRALVKVNLEIKKGDFAAVMGPSGSGKSTLLTLLGCLDRPTRGKIFLGTKRIDITSVPEDELYRIRRNNIGFIFQGFNLIPSLSAIENVELPMEGAIKSGKKRREHARELLELVELPGREKHKPSQISGGEQQRVAIARALANDPNIILADEPTGNLDSETGLSIINMLKRLTTEQGRTVIIVTHDYNMAKFANRKIVIRDGRLETEQGKELEEERRLEEEQLEDVAEALVDGKP
ncbi:MAG: ABC transporter ATP-binding protein [Chloroflexota bacterium]|nr:ABC transporter ATP-binding protein [Chloroflexota bacterium]